MHCPLNTKADENVSVELKDDNYIVHSSSLSHFNSFDRLHIYESKLTSKKRDSLKIQRGKLQSLGIVTTALTHELNNPLTGIYELSNELKKQFTGQVEEDFDEVSKASKRCLSIIETLNNFSSKKIDFERIKLQKIIEDAFSLTKILVQRVKLHCSFEPDVWISGSSTIISQAVFNVLKNSIEAMDHKGEIFISLFKQKGFAVLSFEDRGPGFPENFNQIELFGTNQKVDGVGYGMFLIHEFVKLHGGDLSFGNNKNEAGAYFTMRFPLEQV
jgi:signal transduction histidine kinase